MAAYAALVSLENIIHDIQHHHSPPISFDYQQAQSLTQIVASLQQFLESRHNTSPVTEIDEADPLEMRIADAAYKAEDIIESHIVNRILPAGSQRRRDRITRFFNRFRAPKKPENIPIVNQSLAAGSQHHSPPNSFDNQQLPPITEMLAFLQEFTEINEELTEMRIADAAHEGHSSSSVTEIDEADPLEMRIADAAYETEDTIESHIVNRSPPAESQHPRNAIIGAEDIIESPIVNRSPPAGSQRRRDRIIRFFNRFRAPKKPENIPFSEAAAHHGDQTNIPFFEDETHHDDQTDIRFSETAAHHDDQTNLYEELWRVIEEMESIKELTVQIDPEKEVFHHQRLKRTVDASAAPSKSFSARQNSIMVCSDDIITEVMEKLGTGKLDRHVIPIVGMGGIGKTTLAKNIYEKPFIKEHFQIRAWATISQQYNTKEILCKVLCQATNIDRDELSKKSEDEVGTKLYKYFFGRRYLIVMDDMWDIDAWVMIQRYFPDNRNGSRVLVTTRLSQLGAQLNQSYTHHMKFLDEDSSWNLFSKTVFGEEISCPSELEGIGKKIAESCRGLPLSIVVVGGILKNEERTRGCWESIGKNLTSGKVNSENDKHCLRLLSLSYSHLPAYLKPYFLYMGVFEEDSEIKVSTLVKLWVGEGFLKPINDKSLEAIGKGFLKDLVDRNLILVHALGSTGNIKYCKIHDLLRDLCLSEGKKDGFYHVIGQDSRRDIDRQRRVVISRNTSEKKVLKDLRSMSHVRSVISEHEKVPSCENFRSVRALHAYEAVGKVYVDSDAFQYVNLRHLAVGVDSMSSFFSSITLHWNLHTLIVSCNENSTAPVGIWKMPQFRRIEFINMRLFLPDPPSDAVVMENLQILRQVENFKFSEKAVEKIPNIKKLALRYSGHEGMLQLNGDFYCLSNIQRLDKLESLYVSLWFDFRKVESLNNLTFPHSLKKLTLSMIPKFECNDILEKIGSLPLLEKLKLWTGGFRGGEWEIAEGQFPCLKFLGIYLCSDLRKLTTEEQSSIIFPRLEHLYLLFLEKLEEIPNLIGDLATLQKISMIRCGSSVVKRAKEIVEEQIELQGNVLSFNIEVALAEKNEELQSLAGPNFQVFA